MLFMPGDVVKYVGHSRKVVEGMKDSGVTKGEVVARVENNSNAVVVAFGDKSYIISRQSLAFAPKHVEVVKEPEVIIRRAE